MAATSPLGQRGREVRREVGKARDGRIKARDEKGGWKKKEYGSESEVAALLGHFPV